MVPNGGAHRQGGPTPESVRQELEKILANKRFAGSGRLSRFLRFTVEQTLSDLSANLKEYTIATEVYEKSSSFDPRLDPIVRVEARRLRDRLKEYYESDGQPDPVRIDFPKGSYVPLFSENTVSDIAVAIDERPQQPTARAPASKLRLITLAFLLLLLSAGAYFAWRRLHSSPKAGERMVLVVLPFQNLTGDAEQEYLSDGMTEEMSVRLASLDPQRMAVIARTSAMKYKHTSKSVDEIGRELSVDYLVEGSVRRAGARLRITAQLIQVRDQTHLWAKDYDRDAQDILGVQGEIADAIAGEVQLKISPEVKARASPALPANSEAHEAYLKGRYFFNKGTVEGFQKGIEYFQLAIQKEPRYALAHDGLADSYAFLGRFHGLPAIEAFAKARTEALQALDIDPNLAEAHATLGEILAEYWDWNGSARELKRALEINPNYALAHLRYGGYLGFTGKMDLAVAELKLAQRLDPLSPNVNAELANSFTGIRDYDRAIQQSLRTLELEQDYRPALAVLAESYEKKGMQRESFETYLKISVLNGLERSRVDALRAAFDAGGMDGYWRKRLEIMLADRAKDARLAAPFRIAWISARLGKKAECLESLETAYSEHDFVLAYVKFDPVFDFLHSDPQYQSLMQRIGLPD